MAVTAAVSPKSLPQSSMGLFNAANIFMQSWQWSSKALCGLLHSEFSRATSGPTVFAIDSETDVGTPFGKQTVFRHPGLIGVFIAAYVVLVGYSVTSFLRGVAAKVQ